MKEWKKLTLTAVIYGFAMGKIAQLVLLLRVVLLLFFQAPTVEAVHAIGLIAMIYAIAWTCIVVILFYYCDTRLAEGEKTG